MDLFFPVPGRRFDLADALEEFGGRLCKCANRVCLPDTARLIRLILSGCKKVRFEGKICPDPTNARDVLTPASIAIDCDDQFGDMVFDLLIRDGVPDSQWDNLSVEFTPLSNRLSFPQKFDVPEPFDDLAFRTELAFEYEVGCTKQFSDQVLH